MLDRYHDRRISLMKNANINNYLCKIFNNSDIYSDTTTPYNTTNVIANTYCFSLTLIIK